MICVILCVQHPTDPTFFLGTEPSFSDGFRANKVVSLVIVLYGDPLFFSVSADVLLLIYFSDIFSSDIGGELLINTKQTPGLVLPNTICY